MSQQEQHTRLCLSRRAHRGQLTKLLNAASNLTMNLDEEDNLTSYEGIIDSLDTKLQHLTVMDQQIQDFTPTEKLEETIVEGEEYLEEARGRIRILKTKVPKKDNPNNKSNGGSSNVPKRVNLPKLSLPRFGGDLKEWTTFADTFEASVGSDSRIDDIQKFQYLRGQLDGEALLTIAGLPLTSGNYREAMELLVDRYGQPHKIIETYMKALWEAECPSETNLKMFHDQTESYIRGLRALGKDESSYGDLLTPIVFGKLPQKIKSSIRREHGDGPQTLPELMASIKREILASQAGEDLQAQSSAATFHVGSQQQGAT